MWNYTEKNTEESVPPKASRGAAQVPLAGQHARLGGGQTRARSRGGQGARTAVRRLACCVWVSMPKESACGRRQGLGGKWGGGGIGPEARKQGVGNTHLPGHSFHTCRFLSSLPPEINLVLAWLGRPRCISPSLYRDRQIHDFFVCLSRCVHTEQHTKLRPAKFLDPIAHINNW